MSRVELLAAHRGWKQVLLTGLVFLVLAARVPLYWRTGEFVAEDGWVFFAGAWNHPFWESLLPPYAGYFHLLPRLLAGLCTALPIIAQPYAYAILGLGLNAVILGAFYLPAFRRVLASDLGRFAVVLLLALAPNAQNLGLLLGLHWYLAFGLVLLLLAPFPAGPAGRIGFGLLLLLGAWSSPSAFVLIAPALLFWWRPPEAGGRLKAGLLLGALLVVAALVLFLRISHPERTGVFSESDVLVSLDRLVLRGWLGVGLLGPRVAGILAARFPLGLDAFALAAAGTVTGRLWKNRDREFVYPALLVLGSGLLMLLLSLARTAYVAELATLALPIHTRYLTAPTLLLYVGLGIMWAHSFSLARFTTAAVLFAGLLAFSLPGQNHWSRSVTWFRLRDAVPAIEQLAKQPGPASLYVPADVPYWGPVLEKGGGINLPPGTGLVNAVAARREPDGQYSSWLGRFTLLGDGTSVQHEALGRLEFAGVEQGRVFFRNAAGRELFTSPLLYPKFWSQEERHWSLIDTARPGRP